MADEAPLLLEGPPHAVGPAARAEEELGGLEEGMTPLALREAAMQVDALRLHGAQPSSVSIRGSVVLGGVVHYRLSVHTEQPGDGGGGGLFWDALRRYSQFDALRAGLIRRCEWPKGRATLRALPFPEKRWFGSSEVETVHEVYAPPPPCTPIITDSETTIRFHGALVERRPFWSLA
jgi:hypothetical protein